MTDGDSATFVPPKRVLCLFDVDGTLTESRLPIETPMQVTLEQLAHKVCVGVVGGSDLIKVAEQLVPGYSVDEAQIQLVKRFEYVFAENGLIGFHNAQSISRESLLGRFGEDLCQDVINFCLDYMSRLRLPVKRGNFIEFRRAMINVCPVGRSCSHQERLQFAEYDEKHRIRAEFVKALKQKFPESVGLKFSIGGQISIDIFPHGWDKTFCLQFLKDFDEIHFFGDRTEAGGNDHEIYSHPSVIGHKVTGPQDTIDKLKQIFDL